MADELVRQVFSHVEQTLATIEKKLESSKVLNGGFERLMEKINTIEETQSKILVEVNQLKDTIYHPDDGLYSRIKTSEKLNLERSYALDKIITEIKLNQEKDIKDAEELEAELKETMIAVKADLKKIDVLTPRIDDIERWKSSINKAFWAIAIPMFTMMIKVIYELLSKHVQFK